MFNILITTVLFFISSTAYAEAGKPPVNMLGQWVMLAFFMGIFYLFIIRPQQKKAKEHQNVINNIAVNDEIVTTGGMLAKVAKISDTFLTVVIAEGIEIKIQKQAIAMTIPKGTIKTV